MPDIDQIIPVFFIITTGKSELLYDNIFSDVVKIINDYGLTIDEIPQRIMIDFEKSLQKSVKKNFQNLLLMVVFSF